MLLIVPGLCEFQTLLPESAEEDCIKCRINSVTRFGTGFNVGFNQMSVKLQELSGSELLWSSQFVGNALRAHLLCYVEIHCVLIVCIKNMNANKNANLHLFLTAF